MLASPTSLAAALFVFLAGMLLVLTLAWHVPMMLWDHLDLVPIYQSWLGGELAGSAFLALHGGHMHGVAYAVLLATTALSGGHPWLDCVASWLLLLVHAGIMARLLRETLGGDTRRDSRFAALLVLLALYPGHLANLQWGWQVAVFLCLTGVSTCIYALTRANFSWWHQLAALTAAGVAYFSFATAIALLPTALVLIALRRDVPRARRLVALMPWLLAMLAVALQYRGLGADAIHPGAATVAAYALNFLGACIARFAPDLAPWLALGGLVVGALSLARCRMQRACLPWLGIALFATCASVLVALGRAAPFGSEHAFVTRYVSFSTLFWLGCTGLVACAWRERLPGPLRLGFVVIALLAVANAWHMMGKAHQVGIRTQTIAQSIRSHWPAVDRNLLGEIYFDQPDLAWQRLAALHALGFAPFDAAPDGEPLH
jgi:hypothetical protein